MSAHAGPLWGNFVAHADWHLLSFAWLFRGGLHVQSFYHATQAVEKYLKALALSIVDPDGKTETVKNNPWLLSHSLERLASRCATQYAYYGQPEILTRLTRFSEFDRGPLRSIPSM
jgi:HEPN domain-containing protein